MLNTVVLLLVKVERVTFKVVGSALVVVVFFIEKQVDLPGVELIF